MKVFRIIRSAALLILIFFTACQPVDEWDLDSKGGTDIRRFYGRWTLDGLTEVNLAPFEGLVNGIEVQAWPSRARLGVLVWDETTRTVEATGIDFVAGTYEVIQLDSWEKEDGSFGGKVILESRWDLYIFER